MLCIVGSPLYQWDMNRQLKVDSKYLGSEFEVHCCMNGDPSAPVADIITDGVEVFAKVPNHLLQRSGTLRVYVVIEGDTVYDQSFYVLARPKPEGYIYEESEVLSAGDSFANALKGNKSGAALSLDDVSPMKHSLVVKVRGKNLFNKDNWVNAIGEVDVNGIECLNVGENANSYYEVTGDNSTAYVFTVRMYRNSDFGKATNVKALLVDGTTRNIVSNLNAGETKSAVVYGGEKVHFTGWNKTDICVDLSVTQLEIGTTATEFAPYVPDISAVKVIVNGNEYSVNDDGTVNGTIKSAYPITTITTDTDGAIVECEYNRDINKAFAEVYSAFVAMGGNV